MSIPVWLLYNSEVVRHEIGYPMNYQKTKHARQNRLFGWQFLP